LAKINRLKEAPLKVGYFDCFAGISGDMALGAVVDAGVPLGMIQAGLDSLHLPLRLESEKVKRCGLEALKIHVHVPQESESRYLPEIRDLIDRSTLNSGAKQLAHKVFNNLGVAEARAHGIPLERVHFHEVGALDSIADILGVSIAIDFLGLDRIEASPVSVGSGSVKCDHGLMPVPTPATAFLLEGIPLGQSPAAGELTTPTGAALLKTLVHGFGPLPPMRISQIGLGAGTKTFLSHPNMVRLFLGEAILNKEIRPESDHALLLQTNLDDQTPEQIGFLMEELMSLGALDAWITPILMKKGRPAQEVSVLVFPMDREKVESKIFTLTRTLGIRRQNMDRSTLPREGKLVQTQFGPIRCKVRILDGMKTYHPEYEDCARWARDSGVSLAEIQEVARRAATES
jgi:uncharacterized protein (TIGR00299 family) protein